jgi:ophiobolin F synthase
MADGTLSNEAKREILATMKQTRSLEYTLGVLRELHAKLNIKIRQLKKKFGEENFSLRLMIEMLKV